MPNVGNLVAPWKPGQTGNPNGRPVGSRSAFSQAYVRDFQTVWDESGIDAIREMAKKNPSGFVAVASKLIPQQVSLDMQASLPGNLSLEDWQLLREVIQAVRSGIPDAAHARPGEVFQRVLSALRAAEAKTISSE